MQSISVVGLGKLGQCLAAACAYRGLETLGVDINPEVVQKIKQGLPSVIEPDLEATIVKSKSRLQATLDHQEAIDQTDITCIIVASPSDPEGELSPNHVETALKSLAEALRRSSKAYHLFIVNSTVMPVTTEERLIPLIEECSGRKVNDGFGLCYCPETVALGSVIRDFLTPDFVVIGESDNRAGDQAEVFYNKLCLNSPPMHRMPIVDAEITKLSLNCYITLKISFANTLANLCERIPGADVDMITHALGSDKRISPYYFRGGPAYGGTCFPRDTKAFLAFASKVGIRAELIRAVENVNEYQGQHLAELVRSHLASDPPRMVSVLGLAFKPNTPVITASPSIKLIGELLREGVMVSAYDPLAMKNAKAVFGDKIAYCGSARECVAQSSLCVLATQAEEFKQIDESYLVHNPTTVIDCWRILNPDRLGVRARYVPLGRALEDNTSDSVVAGS